MAAQMSHESRDLAEIYSTERVERAGSSCGSARRRPTR